MIKADKNIDKSSEEKAQLLDLTDDAILVRDASDRITFWNKGATNMYGFSKEEAIGRVSHDLFGTEFPEPLELVKEKLLRDGQWAGELTHICATGARRTVSSRWVVERDASGNIRSVLESNRDITEIKQAQEAQNRLAAIVESSDDAIISKSLDSIITSWNRSAQRMFGYTADEAIGQNILLIIPPERREEEDAIISRLKQGKRIEHFETVRLTKDGTRIDVSLTISPVRDANGRIVGASKIARDITERQKIESALRESEKRFRHLAETLDAEVRIGTRELEERNAEMARQADQVRDLSHRLTRAQDDERRKLARELHDSVGQLLAALSMNIATIERERRSVDDASQKAISDSAGLVEQITQEVRTISHLLHPPLLEVAGLRSAIEWYADGFAERSKISVKIEMPDNFPRLSDETELAIFRMVQECLTNVHRHSGSPTAFINVGLEGPNIIVRVQDWGKGMTTKAQLGDKTGVGLGGMKERLKQIGGNLQIQSNDTGTTVIASVPHASPHMDSHTPQQVA